MSEAICARIPGAQCLHNEIPKEYVEMDLYCNLIPPSTPNAETFRQVPMCGAFEVSYRGNLIFSKLKGNYWPNITLVADKCLNLVNAMENRADVTNFLAGMTPRGDGTFSPSRRPSRISSANRNSRNYMSNTIQTGESLNKRAMVVSPSSKFNRTQKKADRPNTAVLKRKKTIVENIPSPIKVRADTPAEAEPEPESEPETKTFGQQKPSVTAEKAGVDKPNTDNAEEVKLEDGPSVLMLENA
jgi:hypothetical protein